MWFRTLVTNLSHIVTQLTVVVAGIGVLLFFWGLTKFVFKSGDPSSHEEGRSLMIWGIISITVMFSVWGLVSLLRVNLGIDLYVPPDPGVQAIPQNPVSVCRYDATLGRQVCSF